LSPRGNLSWTQSAWCKVVAAITSNNTHSKTNTTTLYRRMFQSPRSEPSPRTAHQIRLPI